MCFFILSVSPTESVTTVSMVTSKVVKPSTPGEQASQLITARTEATTTTLSAVVTKAETVTTVRKTEPSTQTPEGKLYLYGRDNNIYI